jgi:hypothetical protein
VEIVLWCLLSVFSCGCSSNLVLLIWCSDHLADRNLLHS